MSILVFGATGQVARELSQFSETICLNREEANLEAPETCAAQVLQHRPKAVINAAAYTAVDQAETDEDLATTINAAAPAAMAKACKQIGIPFVTLSTDYVFDGSGQTPWTPEHETNPLGAYGRSKVAGEQAVVRSDATYAVLRTSWVFSAHGNNFVKTMLRLGGERDQLDIVSDQIGGPTPARAIAAACLHIANHLMTSPSDGGIYHFSGAPDVSWATFAREIFKQAGITCRVRDIPSSAFPTPAQRPANSRLDCRSLEQAFGLARPDWRHGLTEVLSELKNDKT